MATYIVKPSSSAANDFTGAQEFQNIDEGDLIALLAENQDADTDVYELVVPDFVVTGG